METFNEFIINLEKTDIKKMDFKTYLFTLMNEKDLTSPQIYNAVNMSRQTFSKIYSGETKTSFNNAIKLALGMKLTNEECKLMFKKLDYNLASNSRFNLVIRYCLKYKIYDIDKVNNMLYEETKKTLDD